MAIEMNIFKTKRMTYFPFFELHKKYVIYRITNLKRAETNEAF